MTVVVLYLFSHNRTYLEDILHGPHEPDVVFDELGEVVEVSCGLLVVDLLHLLLHAGQVGERARQRAVALEAGEHGNGARHRARVDRERAPVLEERLGGGMEPA